MPRALPLLAAVSLVAGPATAETLIEMRVVDVRGTGSAGVYGDIVDDMNVVLDATGHADCRDVRLLFSYVGSLDGPTGPSVNAASVTDNDTRRRLLQDAVDLGGNVLVLRDIAICGADTTGVDGCGAPGQAVIVQSFTHVRTQAILWLHELGHSVRLNHVGANDRVMYPQVMAQRDGYLATECDNYLTAAAVFAPLSFAGEVVEGGATPAQADADPFAAPGVDPTLRDLLAAEWIGGPPFEELDAILADDANLLAVRAAIGSEALAALWPNAATVLGHYGDADDVARLRAVLDRRGPGADQVTLGAAKVAAVRALGVLAARTESAEAIGLVANLGLVPDLAARPDDDATAYEPLVATADIAAAPGLEFLGNDLDAAVLYAAALVDGAVQGDILGALDQPVADVVFGPRASEPFFAGLAFDARVFDRAGNAPFARLRDADLGFYRDVADAVRERGVEAYLRD